MGSGLQSLYRRLSMNDTKELSQQDSMSTTLTATPLTTTQTTSLQFQSPIIGDTMPDGHRPMECGPTSRAEHATHSSSSQILEELEPATNESASLATTSEEFLGQVLLGDSLEVLKRIPDNSVDSIVSDPPYGIKFMSRNWDYDVPSVEIWKEVLRVLKPGGHLLSFGGTRTYHRMVVNIEDAGFEIRDQVQWIYGSGFPKSMDISKAIDKAAGATRELLYIDKTIARKDGRKGESLGKQSGQTGEITAPATDEAKKWAGWGTALKPANEPICVARKPVEGTIVQNVLKWGVGGLDIDGSRVEAIDQEKLALNWDRDNRSDIRGGKLIGANHGGISLSKTPPQGRWPANVIFDEHMGAVLDEQSGVLKSGELKGYNIPGASANGHLQGKATRFVEKSTASSGGASRFFYCAKASKSERNAGLEGMPVKDNFRKNTSEFRFEAGRDPTPRVPARADQNHHPTVKPIKLMEYLVRMVTPPGGVVLDPFAGSGSTLIAAQNLGRSFIGIEREKEYVEIAKRRLESRGQMKLSVDE